MDIFGRASGLSNHDADALLAGRPVHGHDDLRDTLHLLRAWVAAPAPAPSPALAIMVGEGLPPAPAAAPPAPAGWRRWGVRAAVAAGAVGTLTLGAATANALPAPLQSAVADVVDAITPFDLPRPPAGSPPEPRPADSPGRPSSTGDADPAAPAERSPEDDGRGVPSAIVPDPAAEPDDGREDGPNADEPSDEVDSDQPDSDLPDSDLPDSDQPHSDQPDNRDGGAADGPAPDAPEGDRPEQPDGDQPDSDQPDVRLPETSPTAPDDPADQLVVEQPHEEQLDPTR